MHFLIHFDAVDLYVFAYVYANHEQEPNYKFLYFEDMATSTFCLCPPGWASWTPRLFEALMFACIPVVVTDGNRVKAHLH